MTGPEHYQEAERLLEAEPQCSCPMYGCVHHQVSLLSAQVHATLAAAAATASDWDVMWVGVDS
jgi:hypothetical protein